ncbi:MAG TPA: class I SAM-dependent methyltransferase [Labilithrix sp.]|nr:class I SAM-dependent methyltransferase [Labilithrix sp.]
MTSVTAALRRGELVYDRVFDDVFPLSVRRASSVHWTPVEVAVRAAKLLVDGVPDPVILDIGAGIGKFCAIAAATVDAKVTGVEHREHFVAIARAAAEKLGVHVDFVHGTLADHDPAGVSGVYMFNPFAENLAAREDHLDDTVELGRDVFWRDVAAAERFLNRARCGTRVVTYCGWGGTMPKGYELVVRERCAGLLEMWRKTSRDD